MVTTTFRRASMLAVLTMTSMSVLIGCGKGADSGAGADVASAGEAKGQLAMHAPLADAALARVSTGTIQLSSSTNGFVARAPIPSAPGQVPTVRQVIRRADLDVRVENVEKAEKAVGQIVALAGGYTESAASSDLASIHPLLNLSLRIPVGAFDSSIEKFEALGIRLSKKISSDDVTGQIVDLDARLKTMRAQENVYRDMLKNRGQLDDVFNIQSKLTEVRTQIESIEGQRKSQAGLAAMSVIALTLEQSAVANQATSDPNWLAQTWGEASTGASASLRIFTVALIWLIAFSPFWIPVVLLTRKAAKSSGLKVLNKS